MGISKRVEIRGAYPLWQVNVNGFVYRGRHKTVVGAINTAFHRAKADQYTDIAIHVFQEAGGDPDAIYTVFCRNWKDIGKDMERKRRWEVDRLTFLSERDDRELVTGLAQWLPAPQLRPGTTAGVLHQLLYEDL